MRPGHALMKHYLQFKDLRGEEYAYLFERAKIIKTAADKVLARLGVNDPLLDIAKQLEEAALSDSYFIERKLYPNVDFYSGVIYKAMGFPTEFFTVLFALPRFTGWMAHWNEFI